MPKTLKQFKERFLFESKKDQHFVDAIADMRKGLHWTQHPHISAAVRYKGKEWHGERAPNGNTHAWREHHFDLIHKIQKKHEMSDADMNKKVENGEIEFGMYNHDTKKSGGWHNWNDEDES